MPQRPSKQPLNPRIIQDVVPKGGGSGVRPLHHKVGDEIVRLHRATNLRKIQHLPEHPAVQRVRSMDVLAPRRPAVPVRQPQPVRQPVQPRPVTTRSATKTRTAKPAKTRRSLGRVLFDFAQYPLIAAIALASAYSSVIGQGLIGLYALVAVVFRWSSRYSFGAAILLLASVPGFQVIHETGVAEKAALYAYELLVIGTVQAILELVFDQHRQKKTKPV